MPWKRGNVYYLKRRLGPLGKVVRSLETSHGPTARSREVLLLDLVSRGMLDAVRAWLDGRVSISELHTAFVRQRLEDLLQRTRREAVPLAVAVERFLAPRLHAKGRRRRSSDTAQAWPISSSSPEPTGRWQTH